MKYLLPVVTLVIGMAIGAGGMSLANRPVPPNDGIGIDPLRVGTTASVDASTTRYTNSSYGFTLDYPNDLSKKEFDAGGGATTIVFQGKDDTKGFQIFIVPYAEAQISQERIKGDLAGAPMENVTPIVLAGNVPAVHFESRAPIIGDSSEVWFIHNGYLYEVTTYRAQDTWLAGILATVQFTK